MEDYVNIGFLLGVLFSSLVVGLYMLARYLFEDTHSWKRLPYVPYKTCRICKKEIWDEDLKPLILNKCQGYPLPIAQRHPRYVYDRREDF